jgi:pyrroline-5-carboxylate reductase
MKQTITFIGAGNMTRALISGLQNNTQLNIRIADPDEQQLQAITQQWSNIKAFTNNADAINNSDIIVFATKPQIMQTVCETFQQDTKGISQDQKPLIISIAAGITISSINNWLGGDYAIVRCMPNTPALVQSGMTGLVANENTNDEQRDLSESILRAVGNTLWFKEEAKLNAVTAVSGSGPAYFFLVMEAMQASAQKLGLEESDARMLVLQTAFGAAKLALESEDDAATLRQRVTSKGGTTEAALKELMDGGLSDLFDTALTAAKERSEALSKQ